VHVTTRDAIRRADPMQSRMKRKNRLKMPVMNMNFPRHRADGGCAGSSQSESAGCGSGFVWIRVRQAALRSVAGLNGPRYATTRTPRTDWAPATKALPTLRPIRPARRRVLTLVLVRRPGLFPPDLR
jgi:hypothetical protein